MKLSHFDLNLLRVLDALLREKSVTLASRRLGISQPAVSGSLQRLRKAFEDPLLTRSGQAMELTAKAEALIAPVRDALHQVQSVLDVSPEFTPSLARRTFNLAMSDYCAQVVLPSLVRRLSREAPTVSCVVQETLRLDVTAMEAGDVDLQIKLDNLRPLTGGNEKSSLQWAPLFTDRLVCVVAKDHPLGSVVSIAEYLSYPHASAGSIQTFTMVGEIHRAANVTVHNRITIGSVGRLPFLLPGTRMIALLPLRLVASRAAELGLRLIEPPFDIPVITETAVWHKRSDSDPGHVWLRNLLLDVCRNLPGEGALS